MLIISTQNFEWLGFTILITFNFNMTYKINHQHTTCKEQATKTKQMVISLPEQKEAQASDSCPPYIVINIWHLNIKLVWETFNQCSMTATYDHSGNI